MSSYRSGSIVSLRVMLLGNYIIIILAKLHILGLYGRKISVFFNNRDKMQLPAAQIIAYNLCTDYLS